MSESVVFSQGFILNDSTATYDFTTHVVSAELSFTAELQDITAMTDRFRGRLPGLKDWSVTVNFNNDFSTAANSMVARELFNMIGSTLWSVTMRVFSTLARSSGNPEYSGSVLLAESQPFSGTVGDVARQSVTFQGNGTLTRTDSAT